MNQQFGPLKRKRNHFFIKAFFALRFFVYFVKKKLLYKKVVILLSLRSKSFYCLYVCIVRKQPLFKNMVNFLSKTSINFKFSFKKVRQKITISSFKILQTNHFF